MKTLQAEDIFMQQVPVKCLKMPDVEDDAVALRNRPIVDRLCPHDVEQGIASAAGIGESFEKNGGDYGISLSSWHSVLRLRGVEHRYSGVTGSGTKCRGSSAS